MYHHVVRNEQLLALCVVCVTSYRKRVLCFVKKTVSLLESEYNEKTQHKGRRYTFYPIARALLLLLALHILVGFTTARYEIVQ